jgi:hypothetical protein
MHRHASHKNEMSLRMKSACVREFANGVYLYTDVNKLVHITFYTRSLHVVFWIRTTCSLVDNHLPDFTVS